MSELRTSEVNDFAFVLSKMEDVDQIYALFQDIMTVREIKEISQRLAVARMLDSGKSYATIEKETGASATTIARVSKALNYGSGGYRAALDAMSD